MYIISYIFKVRTGQCTKYQSQILSAKLTQSYERNKIYIISHTKLKVFIVHDNGVFIKLGCGQGHHIMLIKYLSGDGLLVIDSTKHYKNCKVSPLILQQIFPNSLLHVLDHRMKLCSK